MKVQTKQWTCGWEGRSTATCNCGVVLRDHNDVIEFNCCNDIMKRDQKTPIFVKIRSKKCLAQGISIRQVKPGVLNAKYEVSLKLQKHKLLFSSLSTSVAMAMDASSKANFYCFTFWFPTPKPPGFTRSTQFPCLLSVWRDPLMTSKVTKGTNIKSRSLSMTSLP